jgi:hypothetical protein
MVDPSGSYRDQAAKDPARSSHAPRVFPRDDLEFHEWVLVSLKLALWMSSVADCIPIAERQTNHGIVTRFGVRHFDGVGQLGGKLDHMRETEDPQWAELAF